MAVRCDLIFCKSCVSDLGGWSVSYIQGRQEGGALWDDSMKELKFTDF